MFQAWVYARSVEQKRPLFEGGFNSHHPRFLQSTKGANMNRRELKEGQLVIYRDEFGFVSSWNETAVFVRYWSTKALRFNPTAAATQLSDIRLARRVEVFGND